MFTILIRVTTIQMSVSVYDWYRRTIVTTCLLVFSTVWNTLFPCIFQQMKTHCFPAFSGRLKRLVSFHFPSGSNTKHIISLNILADWNTSFPLCVQQFETHCFPAFFGRLKHLVWLHFPADWNILFPFIFHQVQTHCFLEYFDILKHFISLYFPADSNTLFPCISGGFKHFISSYFWQIETYRKHYHCQEQVKT